MVRKFLKTLTGKGMRVIMCSVAAVAMFAFVSGAVASDKVTLKDGTVLEGTITREVGGIVWIKAKIGGIEQEKMLLPEEVKQIAREGESAGSKDAAAEDPSDKGDGPMTAALSEDGTVPEYKPGVPRGMVITLGDEENGHMVGVYMTAEILKRALPTMEKELGTDRTGILVLRIHSGGGYGAEVPKLSDVIENDLKPRFRVVAWIDHAISAAAMTAHGVEEIYFTTDGEYGSCTGFYGDADHPVEGFELQEALAEMERISDRGKHDRRIMRSMQIQEPLSAHIDETTGEVKYYQDATSGDILVNREKWILCFNANSALKVRFSSGTADSLSDLARLMKVPEIQWVGKEVKGVPWPISKAEEMQIKFRRQTKEDANATDRLFTEYNRKLAAARAAQPADRPAFVGQARQAFERIKAMFRNNPNQKIWMFRGEEGYKRWVEEQEKILRDLLK